MIPTTYNVTLSCYQRYPDGPNGAIRLMPIIVDQIEAESPQEAAYLMMEHIKVQYVDRVEVVLPDGSVFQRNGVLYKDIYSVGLWKSSNPNAFPIIGDRVQAASPLLAALRLMQDEKLTYVARASVHCPDGSIWWKEHLKITKAFENLVLFPSELPGSEEETPNE